ncbi:MAG: hypothetical protein ABDH53_08125 [Pseudothermotoga sp.]
MKKGFLLLDAVVGMCILCTVVGIAFSWVKNQRKIVERLYITDLAHRTVVNVLVRNLTSTRIDKEILNGFELVRNDGKIVLKFNNQLFQYEVEGGQR